MIWPRMGRAMFCTFELRAYVMMNTSPAMAYGTADSTSMDAIEVYVAACSRPIVRFARSLMYQRRPTRRRVRRTLSAIEIEKYGSEIWMVVLVQSEASGRDAWKSVNMERAAKQNTASDGNVPEDVFWFATEVRAVPTFTLDLRMITLSAATDMTFVKTTLKM